MLGTLNNHMTIFKNALATAPINVITNSLETIMEHLFNSVTLAMQIHVTIIVSNIKYHMYYDGNILEEGKNTFKEQRREDEEQRKEDEEQGRTDREQDRTDRELNRKNIEHKLEPIYKDMILYLTGKVQKVIDNHGRIDLI